MSAVVCANDAPRILRYCDGTVCRFRLWVTLSVVGRDLLGSGHVLIIELSVLCASHVSLQSHITQSEYIYYTNLW